MGPAPPAQLSRVLASSPTRAILQRSPATSWGGSFTSKNYKATLEPDPKTHTSRFGANIDISFTPNDNVDAEKIALVQTVASSVGGMPASIYFNESGEKEDKEKKGPIVADVPEEPHILGIGDWNTDTDTRKPHGKMARQTVLERSIDVLDSEAPGTHIDNLPSNRLPLAGLKDPAAGGGLSDAIKSGSNDFGKHFRDKGKLVKGDAMFHDDPGFKVPNDADAQITFETAAMAVAGAQNGAFYGSVTWGWKKASTDKTATLVPFHLLRDATPTSVFGRAAELWNTSKTTNLESSISLPAAAEMFTIPKNAALLNSPGKGNTLATLAANTRVEVIEKLDSAQKDWKNVVVIGGAATGKVGWLKQSDLSDKPTETKPKRPSRK